MQNTNYGFICDIQQTSNTKNTNQDAMKTTHETALEKPFIQAPKGQFYDLGEKERREHHRAEYQSQFFAEEKFEGCQICAKTEEGDDNPFVICEGCAAYFHQHCASVEDVTNPDELWYCDSCVKLGNHFVFQTNSTESENCDVLWTEVNDYTSKESITSFVIAQNPKYLFNLLIKKAYSMFRLDPYLFPEEPNLALQKALNMIKTNNIEIRKLLNNKSHSKRLFENRFNMEAIDYFPISYRIRSINTYIIEDLNCKICTEERCLHKNIFLKRKTIFPEFTKTYNKYLKKITRDKTLEIKSRQRKLRLSITSNEKYKKAVYMKYLTNTIVNNMVFLMHNRLFIKRVPDLTSFRTNKEDDNLFPCPVCCKEIKRKVKNFIQCLNPSCNTYYHFRCIDKDNLLHEEMLTFYCPSCIIKGKLCIFKSEEMKHPYLFETTEKDLKRFYISFKRGYNKDEADFNILKSFYIISKKEYMSSHKPMVLFDYKCYVCHISIENYDGVDLCQHCGLYRHSNCTYHSPCERDGRVRKEKNPNTIKTRINKIKVVNIEEKNKIKRVKTDNRKVSNISNIKEKTLKENKLKYESKYEYTCNYCDKIYDKREKKLIRFTKNPTKYCYDCFLIISKELKAKKHK